MRWLDGILDLMDMSLSKLQGSLGGAVHGVAVRYDLEAKKMTTSLFSKVPKLLHHSYSQKITLLPISL